MPIVLITNPKGGCGKSTAATNLAGYFAWRGHPTMLGDLDRQQSALAWLGIRPATLPHIQSWDRSDEKIARPPKGVTHVVLDTPAGLRGHALRDVMKLADRVIVPVQPSLLCDPGFPCQTGRSQPALWCAMRRHSRHAC